MKLSQLYTGKRPVISFEVFPPKTDEGIDKLMQELLILKKFNPAFISVTYGAGGSTQGRSIQVIKRIKDELGLVPLPHFTCIGSDKSAILAFARGLEGMGINNILALRGDPPKDPSLYHPERNAFRYATELVTFLKENTKLEIAVAGYPEVHPETKDANKDVAHLAEKVHAGAAVIITQLFYDNADYYRFVDNARKLGITVPIIPGILPLTSHHQIERIASLSCGTSKLPARLMDALRPHFDDKEAFKQVGITYAQEQIRDLLAHGAPGVHLYPLNHAEAVVQVLNGIKL